MFVRRRRNPITVRNKKAVNATPNSVEESGDVAAAGYACVTEDERVTAMQMNN